MLTSTPLMPMASPAQLADNAGPHLIILAVLIVAGAGFWLYRRLRRGKGDRS